MTAAVAEWSRPWKNERAWNRMVKTVDRLADLCDHDTLNDGTIHMTSTPGFYDDVDGHPRAVGLSLLTCPDCRPLIEKAIDEACGTHDDDSWPKT